MLIAQSTLTWLFRIVFALVVLRIALSPFELTGNFLVGFIRNITEPVLMPVRWLQSKLLGRFAIPYDFSYIIVLTVISALLIVF